MAEKKPTPTQDNEKELEELKKAKQADLDASGLK